MDAAQLHALVHSFAHVVDGQQGCGNAGQGFHLHAGDAAGFDRAAGFHGLLFGQQFKIHAYLGQRQGMAQRDQLAGAFGGHNAGDAGHAQHVALFHRAALHGGKGFGVHGKDAPGRSLPGGDRFAAHIHHHGISGGIKMGQIIFTHLFLVLITLYCKTPCRSTARRRGFLSNGRSRSWASGIPHSPGTARPRPAGQCPRR